MTRVTPTRRIQPPATAQEDDPTPDLQEVPKAQEEPDSQEVAPQPTEDFEHKYRTLRGKYDAEVPRLHDQVKELTTKLDELSTRLEEKSVEPEPEPQPLVTDADRENFGEDLLDVQRRIAQEVGATYEAQIKELKKVISDLNDRVDGTNTSMTELTFEQRLGRLVPDFDKINQDPAWFSWLDQVDPILRGPRRMMAQQAFANGDAEAVFDYVKMWRESTAPAQTQQTEAQAELEKQVTPRRTTTPATPAAADGAPTYTTAQLDAAWDRVTVLNKAGRYDEANKLEAELSVAMLEGRAQV